MTGETVADTWERGDPYERYIGRWSRQVAPEFLAWLAMPAGRRWLDVGCGTGALSAEILSRAAPSSVAGVEPSAGFLGLAAANLGQRASLHLGTASSLPLADAAVDVVVSGLVLNFVPDLPAAFREMIRVCAPEGTIAAYVWDYADRMEIIRHFWDAAVEVDAAVARQHEGARFPVCRPDALRDAFERAGLRDVATTAIDVQASFRDFDDYWNPFLGGQGPAPAYATSLTEDARVRLRESLESRLPRQPDGLIVLTARAWAVRATVRR